MRIAITLGGMLLLVGIAILLSTNRRAIRPRVVIPALALQAAIAFLVLDLPWGQIALSTLAEGVSHLLGYARAGTEFLFGPLATASVGQNFALQALPTIIFFATLVSILYYLGIMQRIVRWVGGALQLITGISKVESLCAAANIFVGQSEAPLVIQPYLAGLSRSQLFTVMSCGMAGVAGTILAAYASLGIRIDYLLAASFMSAPGALAMAKMMEPDVPQPETADAATDGKPARREPDAVAIHADAAANVLMAAAEGALTGVKLAVAVGAMVLAFVALVALANGVLGAIGGWFGVPGLSLQGLLGMLFAPLLYLVGVPWNDAAVVGGLFGEKVVLNEFIGFISLGKAQAGLAPVTVAIVTFALCGFANFGSIAVQMATTGGLAPSQRPMIGALGIRALVAGSLANLMSAAIAGLMLAS
jgi:CNT family concentrative nucleoside transporter